MTREKMANVSGRAMVSIGVGIPWEMREYPLPDVEPDAILVQITMAGICGSDIHHYIGEYRGRVEPSKENPMIMGHEMVGRIYKMGRNIKSDFLGQSLKEGDRIVYSYYAPCGKCWACLSGVAPCPNRHRFRGTCEEFPYFRGAFAQYYYLRPEQWVYKVPDVLTDEAVVPVNCAISTVTFGMRRVSIPLEGQVVIQGVGGLGLSATAISKEMGASKVIVIDKLTNRLKMSRSFGADYTIDISQYPTSGARVEKVRELTGGKGADLVVEVVGRPEVVPEGIEMLMPGGSYLSMGLVTGGLYSQLDMEKVVHRGITIVGSANYASWTIPKVLDLLVRTKDIYPFDKLISHKFRLEDIEEAFKQAMEGKVIRAAVVPS